MRREGGRRRRREEEGRRKEEDDSHKEGRFLLRLAQSTLLQSPGAWAGCWELTSPSTAGQVPQSPRLTAKEATRLTGGGLLGSTWTMYFSPLSSASQYELGTRWGGTYRKGCRQTCLGARRVSAGTRKEA
eukprot:752521-Hanusia_phi.AAC.1